MKNAVCSDKLMHRHGQPIIGVAPGLLMVFVIFAGLPPLGAAGQAGTAPTTRKADPADDVTAQMKLLNTSVDINVHRMPVNDALDYVLARPSIAYEVDWPALKTVGVDPSTPVTVTMLDAKLFRVLGEVLRQAAGDKLGYRVRGGKVMISTEAQLRADDAALRSGENPVLAATRPDDDKTVLAKLDDVRVTLTLNDIKFSEALNLMHEITNVNFAVDWDALKSRDIAPGAGITVSLKTVKGSDALRAILQQAGEDKIGYKIEHGQVTITTTDRLSQTSSPATMPARP